VTGGFRHWVCGPRLNLEETEIISTIYCPSSRHALGHAICVNTKLWLWPPHLMLILCNLSSEPRWFENSWPAIPPEVLHPDRSGGRQRWLVRASFRKSVRPGQRPAHHNIGNDQASVPSWLGLRSDENLFIRQGKKFLCLSVLLKNTLNYRLNLILALDSLLRASCKKLPIWIQHHTHTKHKNCSRTSKVSSL